MFKNPLYLNGTPRMHAGRRCEYQYRHIPPLARRCGLPAWHEAPESEPRCEFHSEDKPADIGERVEAAVAAGVDLAEARLEGAWLNGASLVRARLGGADLSGAQLCYADLSGADLSYAVLADADLRHARFGSSPSPAGDRPTCLRGADARGAKFTGVRLPTEVEVEGLRIGRSAADPADDVLADEALARKGEWDPSDDSFPHFQLVTPTYETSAQVYRQLRQACQHGGDYQRAGELYVSEMTCLRKQMGRTMLGSLRAPWRLAKGAVAYLWSLVLCASCGYGERPSRAVTAGIVVWLAFAVLHLHFGIAGTPGAGHPGDAGAVEVYGPWNLDLGRWSGLRAWYGDLKPALYFSAVTFTTLGYGDLHPLPEGRPWAAAEAVVGWVLMSLLLVCLVRKFTR